MIENYSAYTQDDNGFYYGIKDKLFKSIIFSDKRVSAIWYYKKLPKKYKHDVEEIHYRNIDGCKYLRSIVTYIQNVDRILKYWYNV